MNTEKMYINEIPMINPSGIPWSVCLGMPQDTVVERLDEYAIMSDGWCSDAIYHIVGTNKVIAINANHWESKTRRWYETAEILPYARITNHSSQISG